MRKTYDREFKLKILRDILEKKVATKIISEEYNISRLTISRWVSEYRRYGLQESLNSFMMRESKPINVLWQSLCVE
ncbi:transposase [Enterococcus sp. DIV1420a]|uniref:transposase n=1 Tax=Enterococcus sp. DIV1420a TaxID=2774672 RepID=UPI003F688DE2